jgi:DNA recombination protein RmuC
MELYFYFILAVVIVLIVVLLLRNKQELPHTEQVPKSLYDAAVALQEQTRTDLILCEQELRTISGLLAARDQQILHLQERLRVQQQEMQQSETRLKTEFENLANRLLEQKGAQMSQSNARQMQLILQPLREKIQEFEANMERKFVEETREKSGLKKEIEQLHSLNLQLSRDANNLASALKGQSKTQGDWGEAQLQVLLENSGLQKGVHFTTQVTYQDQVGASKRPDFIIQLPDNKQLIIDSKVSLTAFERFYNDPDSTQKEKHLKAHIESIRAHVNDLSSKNYQNLPEINSPDYLLLFIPLESALTAATQADARLFSDALDRNIVLVTTSSLLATMRTVAHLWKQEKQNRSVQEIARQSGLLYDKFVTFVDDLRTIGTRLDQAHQAYGDAMNKLSSATRPGDTLIGKAEKIRELGAKATKMLPGDLSNTNL